MNKEDLYNQADSSLEFDDRVDVVSVAMLDEFFDSNVCIPKGNIEYNYLNTGWVKCHTLDIEYRIKPSEPVYEWQWYYIEDGIAKIHPEFMTYGEVTDFRHSFIIEETKRVRNAK